MRMWGFDAKEREVLLAATTHLPHLRAIIERAIPARDLPDVMVVKASVGELDEMYSLVEAMMDGTRSRRKLEVLESMLAGLCNSMDGF
jgi:hypothetical protein